MNQSVGYRQLKNSTEIVGLRSKLDAWCSASSRDPNPAWVREWAHEFAPRGTVGSSKRTVDCRCGRLLTVLVGLGAVFVLPTIERLVGNFVGGDIQRASADVRSSGLGLAAGIGVVSARLLTLGRLELSRVNAFEDERARRNRRINGEREKLKPEKVERAEPSTVTLPPASLVLEGEGLSPLLARVSATNVYWCRRRTISVERKR